MAQKCPFSYGLWDSYNANAMSFHLAKSKVFPPSTFNKSAGLFLKLVSSELESLIKQHPTAPNLSQSHRKALENLKANQNVIIKQADKGGSIVVMDRDHYRNICLDLLKNRTWYKPIPFSQIDQIFLYAGRPGLQRWHY